MAPIDYAPDEVALCILQFLDSPSQLASLAMVSRRWRRLCQDNRLWKLLALSKWPSIARPSLSCEISSVMSRGPFWLRYYRSRIAAERNINSGGCKQTTISCPALLEATALVSVGARPIAEDDGDDAILLCKTRMGELSVFSLNRYSVKRRLPSSGWLISHTAADSGLLVRATTHRLIDIVSLPTNRTIMPFTATSPPNKLRRIGNVELHLPYIFWTDTNFGEAFMVDITTAQTLVECSVDGLRHVMPWPLLGNESVVLFHGDNVLGALDLRCYHTGAVVRARVDVGWPVRLSSDGSLLLTSRYERLQVMNVELRNSRCPFAPRPEASAINNKPIWQEKWALDPETKCAIGLTAARTLCLWNAATGKKLYESDVPYFSQGFVALPERIVTCYQAQMNVYDFTFVC